MLKVLEEHKEEYQFVTDILKNIIGYNKILQDMGKPESPYPNVIIRGLIFNEKYADIIQICEDELDLFNHFGFNVRISKTTQDVDFITDIG